MAIIVTKNLDRMGTEYCFTADSEAEIAAAYHDITDRWHPCGYGTTTETIRPTADGRFRGRAHHYNSCD